MKNLLLVLLVFLFSVSGFAKSIDHEGKRLEFYSGPSLNTRTDYAGNQFDIGAKFGGDTFSGALDLAFGNLMTIKPKFVMDLNYYYKNNELIMGPTFDIGPSFSFNMDVLFINFFEIGIGYKIAYELTNTMGIVFTPVHVTTSIFGWGTNGIGLDAGLWQSYEMYFSIYWLL